MGTDTWGRVEPCLAFESASVLPSCFALQVTTLKTTLAADNWQIVQLSLNNNNWKYHAPIQAITLTLAPPHHWNGCQAIVKCRPTVNLEFRNKQLKTAAVRDILTMLVKFGRLDKLLMCRTTCRYVDAFKQCLLKGQHSGCFLIYISKFTHTQPTDHMHTTLQSEVHYRPCTHYSLPQIVYRRQPESSYSEPTRNWYLFVASMLTVQQIITKSS